jgi:hypothetical protein
LRNEEDSMFWPILVVLTAAALAVLMAWRPIP